MNSDWVLSISDIDLDIISLKISLGNFQFRIFFKKKILQKKYNLFNLRKNEPF